MGLILPFFIKLRNPTSEFSFDFMDPEPANIVVAKILTI